MKTEKAVHIAKQFVLGKLEGQNQLLKKYGLKRHDFTVIEKVNNLKTEDMAKLRTRLMSIEGHFSENYFNQIFSLGTLTSSFMLGIVLWTLVVSFFTGTLNTSVAVAIIEFGTVSIGLLLLFAFLAIKIEERLQRLKSKEERASVSLKESLKFPSYMVILTFCLFAGLTVLGQYLSLFSPDISSSLKPSILQIIIQADGFLIGLSGVIFAQMLGAINDRQNNLQLELIRRRKHNKSQEKYVVSLDSKRKSVTLLMFIVIFIFVGSIALALSGMAQVESKPQSFNITYTFLLMILGIAMLGVSIYQFSIGQISES